MRRRRLALASSGKSSSQSFAELLGATSPLQDELTDQGGGIRLPVQPYEAYYGLVGRFLARSLNLVANVFSRG